jgi:2,4-dienoyl-CoA reductase-like NADH-dependent reductase (Old Yellow Enzyme family)
VWPEDRILCVRLSCTDWVDGGWTPEDTVGLVRRMKAEGADLFNCSSAGLVPYARVPAGPGFMVPLSEKVRREAGVPTATVGIITEPAHADEIIRNGRADIVLIGREELKNPHWPLHAALALRQAENAPVPPQYLRGFPGLKKR